MTLASILSRPGFKTGDYLVTRTAAPTLDASGAAVAGSTSTFQTGDAIRRPLRGRELKMVPDGVHVINTCKLITSVVLLVVPVPDKVTIGSEVWEVFALLEPEGFEGDAFYKAMLVRRSVT